MSIRPKLEELWRSDKSIRTGDYEPLFFATVAPRNPRNGAILLTDVHLQFTREYITDHVWLSYQQRWSSYSDASLNSNINLNLLKDKATRKEYYNKQIAFTARVRPYTYSRREFGLVYTERSYWYKI